MNIDNLIYQALQSNDPDMEFELRFGKYGRISSNIQESMFREVLKLTQGKKIYTYIDEDVLPGSKGVKKRTIYENSALTEQMFKTDLS